ASASTQLYTLSLHDALPICTIGYSSCTSSYTIHPPVVVNIPAIGRYGGKYRLLPFADCSAGGRINTYIRVGIHYHYHTIRIRDTTAQCSKYMVSTRMVKLCVCPGRVLYIFIIASRAIPGINSTCY